MADVTAFNKKGKDWICWVMKDMNNFQTKRGGWAISALKGRPKGTREWKKRNEH